MPLSTSLASLADFFTGGYHCSKSLDASNFIYSLSCHRIVVLLVQKKLQIVDRRIRESWEMCAVDSSCLAVVFVIGFQCN